MWRAHLRCRKSHCSEAPSDLGNIEYKFACTSPQGSHLALINIDRSHIDNHRHFKHGPPIQPGLRRAGPGSAGCIIPASGEVLEPASGDEAMPASDSCALASRCTMPASGCSMPVSGRCVICPESAAPASAAGGAALNPASAIGALIRRSLCVPSHATKEATCRNRHQYIKPGASFSCSR